MAVVVRKKQDDKFLKALRELVTSGGGGNRQCFDCGQKGPTYVNMTIGSFVCTRCSGVLRGITPPHRVKSISMATFTQDELDFLKAHGNELCAKTWLGLWDPKRAVHQDHRELMIDKYERKRYYLEPASPLKSLTNAASLKSSSAAAAAAASIATNGGGNPHIQTNGFGGGHTKPQHPIDGGFQSIQLTPPTSQRTAANGLHKSSSAAISRPQHPNGYNNHQQFAHSHQDAFMIANNNNNNNNNNNSCNLSHNNSGSMNGHNNGLSGLNASVGSASTGALSDTSSCASNGFGPDADFVADFGSASIFDATSAGSVGSPAVSSASSVASSNGYAKVQPIKVAHQAQLQQQQQQQQQLQQQQQQQQFMNGGNKLHNGSNSTNGNTENFADFDHAPIYNAAANYQFIRKPNVKKCKPQQQQQQSVFPGDAVADCSSLFAKVKTKAATVGNSGNSNCFNKSSNIYNNNIYNNNMSHNTSHNNTSYNNTSHNNMSHNNMSHNNMINCGTNNSAATRSTDFLFSESSGNFNDPFDDDFNAIIGGKQGRKAHSVTAASVVNTFESDFETPTEEDEDAATPQSQSQSQLPRQAAAAMATATATAPTKFTPLAMAAHATAMAVLGGNYHFNNSSSSPSCCGQTSPNYASTEWNLWSDTPLEATTTTTTTASTAATLREANAQASAAASASASSSSLSMMPTNLFGAAWPAPGGNDGDGDSPAPPPPPIRRFNPYESLNAGQLQQPQLQPQPQQRLNNNNNNAESSSVNYYGTSAGASIGPVAGSTTTTTTTAITSRTAASSTYDDDDDDDDATSSERCAAATWASTLSPLNPFREHLQASNGANACPLATNLDCINANCSSHSDCVPVGIFARNSTDIDTNTTNTTTTRPTTTTTTIRTSATCCVFNSSLTNCDSFLRCRWRVPIPNGTSATYNNQHSKLGTTPNEDRYAALKDLDEQLRESKAIAAAAAKIVASTVVDAFGNATNNNNSPASNGIVANPFNQQQQLQAQQQQLQAQQQQFAVIANPFQGGHSPHAQNLYGQMALIPNGMTAMTNGYAQQVPPSAQQQHQQQQGFFNGFQAPGHGNPAYGFPTAGVPNGCGFGFGAMQQQIAATGGGMGGAGAFNNPFAQATGALNTNNPFL